MSIRKRVLVTGASKGIGKEIAIHLAQKHYDVVIHYCHDSEGAEDTLVKIRQNDGRATLIRFDVTNREEVEQALLDEMGHFGVFYGIVNNAGIAKDSAFPAMPHKDWDDVINTNLNGFYNVVKPCIMPMIKARSPGRIVAMSSVSGIAGNRGQVNYSASKSAIIGAVKSLAIELAKRRITVNCVAPGIIDTGMITEEVWEHAKKMIPMQRKGLPIEVASTVAFLLDENSEYITRQVISVNGGMV